MVQASFQGVSDLLLSGSSNQFVAAHLNRHIQIMQHLLQQNAFPIIIFIAESGADALKDKLCGAVKAIGRLSPCISEPVITLVNVSPVPG